MNKTEAEEVAESLGLVAVQGAISKKWSVE